MISPSKASKRLGIVGAAAVVGLVPVSFLATPAFAASGASLTVSPSTVGSTSQVVDSFVTGAALTGSTTTNIVATSVASSGCPVGLPVAPASYTVTFTPAGSSTSTTIPNANAVPSTTVTCTGTTYNAATNAGTVTVTVPAGTAIPSGSTVTITANGAQNPTNASSVFFNDSTSAEPSAVSTNTVNITTSNASTPGVSAVNPTAYTDAGGEPFTVTGTNFSTAYSASTTTPSPVVCFVESSTTAPPVSNTAPATNPCAAPVVPTTGTMKGVVTSAPATVTAASPTEIQGTSPALTPGHNYNVVVYNYNGGATPATYTAASGTSSQTLVGVSSNLNVVPESGVRVVDSRSGVNLPKGDLTPGTPTAIPLSAFTQSLSMPTNLPGSYSGLAVNVTAVAPANSGNVQVWNAPAGTCPNGLTAGAVKPATVNFQQPQDTNNAQFIPITSGSTGELCVQDNGAPVSLVIDLVGYTTNVLNLTDTTTNGPATTGGASYSPPKGNTRVLDTRTGTGGLLGPLQSGTVYQFNAANAGLGYGSTVALNVAAVAPSAAGNLRVFPQTSFTPPAPADVPNAAVDNYIVNTDSSAELVTTVPPSGILDIYSAGTGSVNVVIDALGSFTGAITPTTTTGGNTGASIHPLAQPVRIYDSRPGPIPAAGTVTVTGSPSGSGANFVPSNALGLVGNLSDINPAGPGYLVTYPAGGTVPGTASIANFPLQTRNTNNAVALNPSNGSFSIYAGGAATNTTYDASAWIG